MVASPQVIAHWGTKLPEVTRGSISWEAESFEGQQVEMHYDITAVRPLSPKEAGLVLGKVLTDLRAQFPEFETRYIELSGGHSPQEFVVQGIGHTPFAWAGLARIIVPILTSVWFWVGVTILVAAPTLIYALARRVEPPDFPCYKCGKVFPNYEALVAHMWAEHPGNPVPPPPTPWWKYAVYIAAGLAGAYALFKWALPAIRKPKPG